MTVVKFALITTVSAYKKAALTTMLLTVTLLVSACNTVSVSQQSKSKMISSQRGNIVSDDKLSNHTAASLLAAGLNEQACFQYFDLCLEQLADSILDDEYRAELAVFAELHYAKARQLSKSQACQAVLSRPPLDPYYANAPLDEDQLKNSQQKTVTCLVSYQQRLFDAIKSSYAYLFYDSLAHDFERVSSESKEAITKNRIPNDVDIQTQDIYNAASNDVITQLYQSAAHSNKLMGHTKVEYLPTTVAISDSTQAAITNNVALKGKVMD